MKSISIVAFLCAAALASSAQDITTADAFFGQVSDRYAQIKDYEARLTITANADKTVMNGNLAFKTPSLLRIDFVQPPDQVIAFDGQTLTVYIPSYRAVLSQSVGDKPGAAGDKPGAAGGASLASAEGLRMMKRNYTMAFEASPAPVPLEGSPGEQVVRLVLSRKTVSEGYRTVKLSVNPESKLIRRIEGWTLANDKLTFDFTGIKTNQGIPDARFVYDSPASANVYNNFLFKSDSQ